MMKFFIPIKLLALTEMCLVVMFSIITLVLGNNFRKERLSATAAHGEALAQIILLEIAREKAPNAPGLLQDIANLQTTLAWLYHEKPALELAHIAILKKDGTIVAHTETSLQGTRETRHNIIKNLGWHQTRTVSADGSYHVMVPITQAAGRRLNSTSVAGYVGTIDIAYPGALANDAFREFMSTMITMFLATLGISIPLLWIVSHLIVTKPMLYLAQVGEQIAQGQPIDSIHFTKYHDERAILAGVLVSISQYFREVSTLATQIASGSLGDKSVEKRSKRDILGLALQNMLSYLQTVATLATRIGAGDLTMTVPLRSDHDAFGRALQQMVSSLQNMSNLAAQISSGDLRGSIEPRSELDELGHAFQSMTRYLNTLAETATAIAGGDLAQDVEPHSEYDVLGNAFHTMAVRLRENFDRIQREVEERTQAQDALEKLNEELEERVKERTFEVATAYKEIQILNEQLKEENLRMGAELDVARRLQTMILPLRKELQAVEDLEIDGYMQPAEEVGGDYYDILREGDITHIGIGDVTGHGLESGVLMLMTQTAVRTLIEHGETDCKVFLNTLNRVLFQNIQRMGLDLSLTFAFLNHRQNRFNIVGQHEELLVVRQDAAGQHGRVERVDTTELGFPLGMVANVTQWVSDLTIDLQPGDGIVLYTDGIPEAENLEGKHYGVERLCRIVGQSWHLPIAEIRECVINDVNQHIDTQKVFDDITLVIVKQK